MQCLNEKHTLAPPLHGIHANRALAYGLLTTLKATVPHEFVAGFVTDLKQLVTC